MIQDFKNDFIEMCNLIKGDKPFVFMRFADGEIGVMEGRSIIGSDNWTSPNRLTLLGSDLLEAISRVDNNIYYGLSCGCCDLRGRDYLLSLVKNPNTNITFSNIFVNGNYSDFLKFLKSLDTKVYLIANEAAELGYFPLEVEGYIPVPDNCVDYWEENSESARYVLKESLSGVEGKLFLVSAGPMSEAIIDYLWKINPHNKYVDVGSAIAEFVHGRPIRDFAYNHSPYHNKNCIF